MEFLPHMKLDCLELRLMSFNVAMVKRFIPIFWHSNGAEFTASPSAEAITITIQRMNLHLSFPHFVGPLIVDLLNGLYSPSPRDSGPRG